MSIENLLLLLVFIALPLLERLSQWLRRRAEQGNRAETPQRTGAEAGRDDPAGTPERRPVPSRPPRPDRPRPAEPPRQAPMPEPARQRAEPRRSPEERSLEDVTPERHEPVWNDAAWRYPTPEPTERPAPIPAPRRAPSRQPAPRPQRPAPIPAPLPRPQDRQPHPGRVEPGPRGPARVPTQRPHVPAEPPQPQELWRHAEAIRQTPFTVDAGDLTASGADQVLVSPAARRRRPTHGLRLTSRTALRRGIILMTILGPCKADEAPGVRLPAGGSGL
jgi:hypothetical protein